MEGSLLTLNDSFCIGDVKDGTKFQRCHLGRLESSFSLLSASAEGNGVRYFLFIQLESSMWNQDHRVLSTVYVSVQFHIKAPFRIHFSSFGASFQDITTAYLK